MQDFLVEVQSLWWVDGWFRVDLIHSTYTTSAHDTNKQGRTAGLAKNAQSGPIIGAVQVGDFEAQIR